MKNKNLRALTEGAVLVALGFVLSFVKLYELPNGGSLTPAMFPILLFALRFGLGRGLIAGFVFGYIFSVINFGQCAKLAKKADAESIPAPASAFLVINYNIMPKDCHSP